MAGQDSIPIGRIVGLDKAEGEDLTAVTRIHVLTVNNCPYCGSPQGQPHISKDCPGDFSRRYQELLEEVAELRQRVKNLEQSLSKILGDD